MKELECKTVRFVPGHEPRLNASDEEKQFVNKMLESIKQLRECKDESSSMKDM